MAEEEKKPKEAEEEQEEEKTRKPSLKWAMWGGIIVVQLIIAFFLVKVFLFPRYVNWVERRHAEEVETRERSRRPMGEIYKISDLTVNPRGTKGTRFAVFEVAVETDPETVKILKTYEPEIKDRFIAYFRSRTVSELSSLAALDSTKRHLAVIVNEVLYDRTVDNIYFTRFVLQ